MLKLPHSFCRYLKLTCENIRCTPHVSEFSHLSCIGKTCCTEEIRRAPLKASSYYLQQYRLLASIKKRFRIKIPPLSSNEPKKNKQMSESLQPNLAHVSCGGQFNVSDNRQGRRNDSTPKFRVWETVANKSDSSHDDGMFRFKVVSYNVLAQYLLECHPYLYRSCHPGNLRWKVRSARLFDEIISLSPDILCLQEVQETHLRTFYSKFEEMGYIGLFKQKTGHRQDGCAIYFKQSLFELIDHTTVEFYQPELPILNRDNVGLMVKLAPLLLPGSPLVVATTHLLYNPLRTDVRLAQIQVFLAEIDRFAYQRSARECGHVPIILTGDLNSPPDSAVIKLLDRGHVSARPYRDTSDWQRIGITDNCQHLSVILDRQMGRNTNFNTIKLQNSDYNRLQVANPYQGAPTRDYSDMFNSGVLGHSLQLASVYNKHKADGSREASTFQDYWLTVDYIYFSVCSSLKLVERLRLPTAEQCEILGPLPNDTYASDHLVLAAFFELGPFQSSL